MSGIDAVPPNVVHNRAGKFTDDPVKNVPQFPDRRVKNAFAEPNSRIGVQLNPNQNAPAADSFDLIKEINARDPKKYKLDEIRPKKQVRVTAPGVNQARTMELVKKNREEFRRSLVDIIM
jgi:hypothetical protein